MVSKTIAQILYAEGKPPQHFDDTDKWHYKTKIIPRRRLITAGLAGSSAILGAAAITHHEVLKKNLKPKHNATNLDPELRERYEPSKDSVITLGTGSALFGSGALALGTSRKLKNIHDYKLYRKQRLDRGKLPMSFDRFEHEVKHLNK
jgi:hypothetical protein